MKGKTVLEEHADIYCHPEEHLTEKEKLRRMSWKERVQYFLDYYGKPAGIVVLLILSLVCMAVFRPTPSKETVLYVGFINEEIDQEQKEAVQSDLANVLSFDPEKECVLFDYTLFIEEQPGYLTKNTMTVLTEQFYTGNIDLLIAPRDVFLMYEEQGAFLALKDVLPEEDYQELEAYLYDDYSYSLENSSVYHSFASIQDPVVGICAKSKRMERGIAFIKYFLKNESLYKQ